MNPHSKAKLTALSRAEMIRRIVHLHQPVAEVAAGFGLSERCAYKWLARFRAQGAAGLHNRSSRPLRSPSTTHPLRVARVLALRRRKLPGCQIAGAAKLSKASVSRLLRRHAARLAALSPPPPIPRSEREHPGDLLHFDIKKLARIVRTGHRVTGDRQRDPTRGAGGEYLRIAIDDHSRLCFAQLLPDETARSVIAFLHASLAFCKNLGVRIQRISSDNGSADRSRALASPGRQPRPQASLHPLLHSKKPTARPSASSKPPCANGPVPTPMPTPLSAQTASATSSTMTTSTALTTPSISSLPSHASPVR